MIVVQCQGCGKREEVRKPGGTALVMDALNKGQKLYCASSTEYVDIDVLTNLDELFDETKVVS